MTRVIVSATIRRPDLRWKLPPDLAERLQGRQILSLRRRGKYIFVRLSGGESLLIHLGMSGRITVAPIGSGMPQRHEHMVMDTDQGWRVSFVDPRRFGYLDILPTVAEEQHHLVADMGPEPLSEVWTPEVLSASLAGRRMPIKAALLDQRIVAGLGNIYACEALFRARISPRRLAASVAGARAERLVPAIKATLEEAIAAGGSSLRDYRQASGELGYFQHAWKVYGREGENCESCDGCGGIRRIVQSGRSTFFCAKLQR